MWLIQPLILSVAVFQVKQDSGLNKKKKKETLNVVEVSIKHKLEDQTYLK